VDCLSLLLPLREYKVERSDQAQLEDLNGPGVRLPGSRTVPGPRNCVYVA